MCIFPHRYPGRTLSVIISVVIGTFVWPKSHSHSSVPPGASPWGGPGHTVVPPTFVSVPGTVKVSTVSEVR